MHHPLLQFVHRVYTTYLEVITAITIIRLTVNRCPYRAFAALSIPIVVNRYPNHRTTDSEHLRKNGTETHHVQETIPTDQLGELQLN